MDVSMYNMKYYITALVLLSGTIEVVNGIKQYDMENYCGDKISMIFQSIYQGRLQLKFPMSHYEGYACDTQIETWITWDRLMFYFEELNIPCEDGYLQFYDGPSGDSRISGLPDRVCGMTTPSGSFAPLSRKLTVKYTARHSGYSKNVFSMVFTTFNTGSCESYEYECDNGRCIQDEVNCNGYNSCGDNSDCQLTTLAIIGIVTGGTVALVLLVSVVVMCCCRKRNKFTSSQQGAIFNQPVVYTNASGPTVQLPGHTTTPVYNNGATPDNFSPPPAYSSVVAGQQTAYPGNWGQQNVPQQHKEQQL